MLAACLVARATYLQVFDYDFYHDQGEARQLRSVAIPAHRGDILDRSGDPLAISTPIQSLWGVPEKLAEQPAAMREVAAILQIDDATLNKRISQAVEWGKEFIYVKRHALPASVDKVMELPIEGLSVQREYRRYYPSGSVASHLIFLMPLSGNQNQIISGSQGYRMGNGQGTIRNDRHPGRV